MPYLKTSKRTSALTMTIYGSGSETYFKKISVCAHTRTNDLKHYNDCH